MHTVCDDFFVASKNSFWSLTLVNLPWPLCSHSCFSLAFRFISATRLRRIVARSSSVRFSVRSSSASTAASICVIAWKSIASCSACWSIPPIPPIAPMPPAACIVVCLAAGGGVDAETR